MMSRFSSRLFVCPALRRLLRWTAAVVVAAPLVRGQWVSETYTAPAGWSAIWLPIDLSHTSISEALSGRNDIEEIWRWNPPSGPQFVTNPGSPVQTSPNWNVWRRGLPAQSTLFSLTGNAAYLVKVRDGASAVTFTLKGRPVRPEYPWSTTGVNLVGFSTASPAPTFTSFLSLGGFTTEPGILSYVGGALSSTAPKNPIQVLPTETVARGKAYWVQATRYTNYYGPLAIEFAERSGLNFGKGKVALVLRLKNVTTGNQARSLTVTLTPQASEAPPAIVAGTAVMGSGATAGRVASIAPDLNNGVVYATPPVVTIAAPGAGTTATATAVLNSGGRIASFNVTNMGAGYGTVTPVVTVTPVIAGLVPLRIRGAFDPVTSTYAYTALTSAYQVEVAAGATVELTLVVDRTALGSTAGTLFASLLRITESSGFTRFDVPVTAVSSDFTGLWTGVAQISQVDQILGSTPTEKTIGKAIATIANGAVNGVQVTSSSAFYDSMPSISFSGGGGTGAQATAVLTKGLLTGITVTSGGSGYTTEPTVTVAGGERDPRLVARSFPLRLIVHRAANGDTRLIQQVYVANDTSGTVLATSESLFPSNRRPTSRASSAHFPSDLVRLGTGALGSSGTVSFDVLLDYDADTNPFVHRYHPDHDNLDARFETKLPAGRESLTIRRAITLQFQSSLPGISDPSWGVNMIGGTYSETITGLRSVPVATTGTFILYRVDDSPSILTP